MGIWPVGCFEGRRALIVGGTSGIGAAIARGFLDEKAEVVATGASQPEIDAARAALPGANHVLLDVRDAAAVSAEIAALGALDHLVYAAGIIRRGEEHDPAVFDEVVDVNLHGAMRAAAAARPLLAARGGSILFVASMLSYFGGALVPAYSASKGGVAQLTKSLALAYAAEGIRVNAVAPGWIATPLTRNLRADPGRSAAILARTPLGRWGEPDDLVGAALFLASPLAGFITGAILPVDGGYLAA